MAFNDPSEHPGHAGSPWSTNQVTGKWSRLLDIAASVVSGIGTIATVAYTVDDLLGTNFFGIDEDAARKYQAQEHSFARGYEAYLQSLYDVSPTYVAQNRSAIADNYERAVDRATKRRKQAAKDIKIPEVSTEWSVSPYQFRT